MREGIAYLIRCQECGDSKKNPWKKHCAVFEDGGTYCVRCGHSSQLGMEAQIELAMSLISVEEAIETDWEEIDRSCTDINTERFTHLDIYESEGLEDYYSFRMRSVNGTILGYHNRHKKKKTFHNEGYRGFGYVGDKLISTPDRPLVIVEGPYDVIEPHYVCVFGTLNKSSLKALRLQYVYLWPDPDCLDTEIKRLKFDQMCHDLDEDNMVFVKGFIISNDDPDKATKKEFIQL